MSARQWFWEYEYYHDGKVFRILKSKDFPPNETPKDYRYMGLVPTDVAFAREDTITVLDSEG